MVLCAFQFSCSSHSRSKSKSNRQQASFRFTDLELTLSRPRLPRPPPSSGGGGEGECPGSIQRDRGTCKLQVPVALGTVLMPNLVCLGLLACLLGGGGMYKYSVCSLLLRYLLFSSSSPLFLLSKYYDKTTLPSLYSFA